LGVSGGGRGGELSLAPIAHATNGYANEDKEARRGDFDFHVNTKLLYKSYIPLVYPIILLAGCPPPPRFVAPPPITAAAIIHKTYDAIDPKTGNTQHTQQKSRAKHVIPAP